MTNELYHYGVPGMKWGKRKANMSTDPRLLSKAAKRYDKKVKRGSSHNITGIAFEDMGYKKLANHYYKKGNYQEAKWKAKSDRAKKINKAYNSYVKDLDKLSKSGRGNDVDAIVKRSKMYDSQISAIKSEYRDAIRSAKQALNG